MEAEKKPNINEMTSNDKNIDDEKVSNQSQYETCFQTRTLFGDNNNSNNKCNS